MNNLSVTIERIFKGAAKSFSRFPAAIISAIVISIAAVVRITMESEAQRKYNLALDSIQISFALGAAFSMAAVTLREIRSNERKPSFLQANASGIILAIISFLLLYFFGGIVADDKIVYLSSIASARAGVGIFISTVAFIYVISKSKLVDSFSDSFFITQKAFVISAIYGIVIMAGVSGVIGAFQALVYRNLHYSVYQYLGVVVGFLTYTIFLGYFPSFGETGNIEEIKIKKEQSRFIFVLLEYILIPIIMALTAVLLIWTVLTVSRGVDVSFNRLSGIASSYVIVGIWLHILVDKHQSKIAKFYKKAYPFAGVLILIFEAWALFVQLSKLGLRTAEYSFLMIWIFATASVLLLVFLKDRAYRKIAIAAVVVSIIWVLPIIGYQDITFNSQVKRLDRILTEQELLVDGKIVAKDKEIEQVKRGEITEAVDFISNSEKTNTPKWFTKDLNIEENFEKTFGFEKTYGVYVDPGQVFPNNFGLKPGQIDITDYSLSLIPNFNPKENQGLYTFEGKNGRYDIMIKSESLEIPKIVVKLENKIVLEKDMTQFISDLKAKYPARQNGYMELPLEDMSLTLEFEDVTVLLVFNNIESYNDQQQNKTTYYINSSAAYIKYK